MKKWLSARINPKFRPNLVPNCGEDLFFFDFNRIRGQNLLNFWSKPFLFFSLQWNSETVSELGATFPLNFIRITNAFGQGLESVPPMQNFII